MIHAVAAYSSCVGLTGMGGKFMFMLSGVYAEEDEEYCGDQCGRSCDNELCNWRGF